MSHARDNIKRCLSPFGGLVNVLAKAWSGGSPSADTNGSYLAEGGYAFARAGPPECSGSQHHTCTYIGKRKLCRNSGCTVFPQLCLVAATLHMNLRANGQTNEVLMRKHLLGFGIGGITNFASFFGVGMNLLSLGVLRTWIRSGHISSFPHLYLPSRVCTSLNRLTSGQGCFPITRSSVVRPSTHPNSLVRTVSSPPSRLGDPHSTSLPEFRQYLLEARPTRWSPGLELHLQRALIPRPP